MIENLWLIWTTETALICSWGGNIDVFQWKKFVQLAVRKRWTCTWCSCWTTPRSSWRRRDWRSTRSRTTRPSTRRCGSAASGSCARWSRPSTSSVSTFLFIDISLKKSQFCVENVRFRSKIVDISAFYVEIWLKYSQFCVKIFVFGQKCSQFVKKKSIFGQKCRSGSKIVDISAFYVEIW